MKKIIALIPLRANSRRVPKKNIRNFGSKPLYQHIINTLMQSKYISKIAIDTNSEEIKSEVRNVFPNVLIIDRPEDLSSEFTSVNDLIKYDMEKIGGDIYIQTHSTNPLLRIETIDSALEKFLNVEEIYDSLFSVTRMFQRYWDKDWRPVNHNPKELIRTQDLPPFYLENSSFFVFTKNTLLTYNSRIGEKPFLFEIPAIEATDIDEEIDLEYAEFLYKKLYLK